jgi:hypothetical protein
MNNDYVRWFFQFTQRIVNASTVAFYKNVVFNVEREHKDLWEAGTTTLKMRKCR